MDSPKLNIDDLALNTFHTGTDLHTAAVNGDKLSIERILQQQGDIQALNKGDKYGRTALVYTVFGDWYECAELLVRNGASIQQVDDDRRSVLHWAAYLDRPKFIKLFLEHVDSNLECNFGDKDGRTALHYAAMQANPKCLRLLLKRLMMNKRTLNTTDNEQMSALHWSVFYNRLENFKLLMREGADTTKRDVKGRCLLHMAALNPNADSVKIARILLKLNRHISRKFDCHKCTSLHLAVANGNQELVRELCMAEEPALNDLDDLSRSVLHYAVLRNDIDLIDILVSAGVFAHHVDNTGASALHYAAKNDNAQIMKRFLECYKNLEDCTDNQGRTALMWAASEGSLEVLKLMLKNLSYFNIHASDDQGLTALHFACFAGHEECVQLLLENSADISQPDKLGQTALFKACQQGHRRIIDILMDRAGTPIDNNEHQSNANQGILGTIGSHLSSIREESVVSIDTLRTAEFAHVNERANLAHKEKSSPPGYETPEGVKPEGKPRENRMKAFRSLGLTARNLDLGEFSEAPADFSSQTLDIHRLEDDNGCTPLHFAAHAGHKSVCTWLLSQGVDPGKKDVQGRTALHGAAFKGHTECMALMLSHNPDLVNDRDDDGYSVLHHAAINGQLEAVKLLVSDPFQAFLNYRVTSTDWTPLDFAMAADHQDVIQFLMDNGALTIARLQDLAADKIKKFLRRLVLRRREEKVKPLIERHKQLTKEEHLKHSEHEEKNDMHDDVTYDDVTEVFNKDNETKCSQLNDEAIDRQDSSMENTDSETSKRKDTVHNDLNSEDHRPTAEVSNGLRTITEDEKKNFDLYSESDLSTTDDEQLRTFPGLFYDMEICDNTEQILLLNACYHGDVTHVQKLLQGNVSLDYRDENGCTVLHFAAGQGNETICKYLLQQGAETRMRDINGRTPLHNAAISGNTNCVSLLLSYNQDIVSYLNCDHRNALHYAAGMGHLDTVKYLLSDASWVRDYSAKSTPLTALDCAILGRHDDVVEFMIGHGLQPSGLLDRAARVIQKNFRKWSERHRTQHPKNQKRPFAVSENKLTNDQGTSKQSENKKRSDKNSENGLIKNSNNEKSLENTKRSSANLKETSLEAKITKAKFMYETKRPTTEKDMDTHKLNCNPKDRLSERLSQEIKSNPGKNNERRATSGSTYSKHSLDLSRTGPPRENSARAQGNTGLTFAQSNVENLSRAPQSVIVAAGKTERIFELRSNWERIALLRRKKQAALVIQRHFRKHLKLTKEKVRDNIATDLCKTNKEKSKAGVNPSEQCEGISHKNNHENETSVLGMNLAFDATKRTGKIPSGVRGTAQKSPQKNDNNTTREKVNKIQSIAEKNAQSNSEMYSQKLASPRRLTRKAVVNRLRPTSPEYGSSENEPLREKSQYKSSFPLLSPPSSAPADGRSPSNRRVHAAPISPKSSSTSSNRSPSNPRVKNRHDNSSPSNRSVDVGQVLSKNDLVQKWLSDTLGGDSSPNTKNTDPQLETPNSEPRSRKTDPSKVARRPSSHPTRVRRDSLIKNVYGSPAAHSYNFALDTYHPLASRRGRKDTAFPFRTSSRLRPNSMKRVEGGWVRTTEYGLESTTSESCNNTY
ncbi:serine/threonine-protein phosphatase 6 regulatory ankyrin repeat subunit A-like [Dendronephthya gigantea]|uniref:serine/threonine-protein phosphatase 6 regulatory ankyrin repeat subunit A-like n=1 Tax=Dendronephthya gigantea TaxID=151771 RepID=UPI00106C9C4D|nr:serine/threonine-protein phosphatase 6 regulatory ankyrin repeat subunit A-like [Dendronephthya gigantea]